MKIVPKNGYVIVKPLNTENKTEGGLFIVSQQDTPQNGITKGVVVAHCETYLVQGFPTQQTELKVGDVIVYFKPAGQHKIKDGEEEYILVREIDIMAVIEE